MRRTWAVARLAITSRAASRGRGGAVRLSGSPTAGVASEVAATVIATVLGQLFSGSVEARLAAVQWVLRCITNCAFPHQIQVRPEPNPSWPDPDLGLVAMRPCRCCAIMERSALSGAITRQAASHRQYRCSQGIVGPEPKALAGPGGRGGARGLALPFVPVSKPPASSKRSATVPTSSRATGCTRVCGLWLAGLPSMRWRRWIAWRACPTG
jgi:hypothetical protein